MTKRTLLLLVALVSALALAATGTLAYLTDTDNDVNVMTLGNVSIEQIELKRAEGVAHNATAVEGSLIPFQNDQPLYPAYPVTSDAYTAEPTDMFVWGPYVTADNDQNQAANGLWNDQKLVGVMDKFVFVKNTGDADCYFRTWIAFECPEGIDLGEASQGAELMCNVNAGYEGKTPVGFADIEVDGVTKRYEVFCLVYARENGVLPAGETARPSLLQVVLTHNATNEDMELLGDTYEVLTFSQACQTENFPDAKTALDNAFGEATIENLPWTEAVSRYDGYVVLKDGTRLGWLQMLEEGYVTVDEEGACLPVKAVFDANQVTTFCCDSTMKAITGEGKYNTLETLIVPDGVEVITSKSFYESPELKSVTLPDDIQLARGVFISCNKLAECNVPSSFTKIPDSLFRGTALTSVVIPDSVTVIEQYAFRESLLESITIPASVTEIGEFAFRSCPNLRTVYIEGDDVSFTGSGVFSNISSFNSGDITIYVHSEEMKARVEAATKTNAAGVVKVIVH